MTGGGQTLTSVNSATSWSESFRSAVIGVKCGQKYALSNTAVPEATCFVRIAPVGLLGDVTNSSVLFRP